MNVDAYAAMLAPEQFQFQLVGRGHTHMTRLRGAGHLRVAAIFQRRPTEAGTWSDHGQLARPGFCNCAQHRLLVATEVREGVRIALEIIDAGQSCKAETLPQANL